MFCILRVNSRRRKGQSDLNGWNKTSVDFTNLILLIDHWWQWGGLWLGRYISGTLRYRLFPSNGLTVFIYYLFISLSIFFMLAQTLFGVSIWLLLTCAFVCCSQIMALLPKLPQQPELLQTGNKLLIVWQFPLFFIIWKLEHGHE